MQITIKEVIRQGKRKNRNIDRALIEKAYNYAEKYHKGQLRKSGEPYIIHPLSVAYIVADLGLDTETICAALLHDVVEDTEATYEDIANNFNVEIAQIVEGVTKLNQLFKTAEEKQAENYKKMFIAMEKDIRVILLKLADRLHNISTLEYLKEDRQLAIAKETIEFYAPIAHKLGMYDMKMKLQDRAFKYLYPEECKKITADLAKKFKANREFLEKTKMNIDKELRKQRIAAISEIETKHIYNIFKKIQEKNVNINQIKDLFSIKIITKSKQDCYKALGALNTVYKIIPRTFKDYIAIPRNNMYQAIHEIIIGEKGVVVEAQICSYDMNVIAKYGITNYFRYIKKEEKEELVIQSQLAGIHDTLELKRITTDPNEFLNTLRTELFDDEIYVFTPKGDIQVLPKDSTALDFAYHIHTHIGRHIKSCIINGVEMPITTKLRSGRIVEIITSKSKVVPKREWLDVVKTAKAKREIIEMLNENQGEEKIKYEVEIIADDKINLVLDITKIFTKIRLNILAFNTEDEEDETKIKIIMETRKVEKIEKLKEELYKLEEIREVSVKSLKDANSKNKDGEK